MKTLQKYLEMAGELKGYERYRMSPEKREKMYGGYNEQPFDEFIKDIEKFQNSKIHPLLKEAWKKSGMSNTSLLQYLDDLKYES